MAARAPRSRLLHPDHRHPRLDATATIDGFAPSATVVEGMEVVKAILAAPRSPTKGEGVMKGQMLEPVVKM